MIRWFAKNDLAANLLMAAILVGGVIVALTQVPLEVRPTREYPMVSISIPYRGASPEEIEREIIIPVEQTLSGMSGIDEINSSSSQNSGSIYVYMKDGVDPKERLPEIERRVRSVSSLPANLDPISYTIPDTANYFEVISVVVQACHKGVSLQELTEEAFKVKDSLLALSGLNRVEVIGTSPREFAIRLDQEKLYSYGLTFDSISSAIKNNSQELGAGMIKYETGSLALRPGKIALVDTDFAKIPIPLGGGETIPLNALGEVHDGFTEELKLINYDGKPALIVEVLQTREQSAIRIAKTVKGLVASYVPPPNFRLHIWDDESFNIQGRLKTLSMSLLQGGILVMIILGLFLRPAIAFWVVLGIPVSFAGGIIFMPFFGITGNMMSIFAFILVLGIVVDDAIVTGESIFQRMQSGETHLEAAVKGTKDVSTPVIFGVLTTIVAFLPLYSFDGWWGVLAKQIPPIVAPVLIFSLIESKLILPGHLKHLDLKASSKRWYNIIPDWFNSKLSAFTCNILKPAVWACAKHRYITLALFLSLSLACLGYWQSGKMGFQVFPTVDSSKITCQITMPGDQLSEETEKQVKRIYLAAEELRKELRDGNNADAPSLVTGILTSSGGYPSRGYNEDQGYVIIELLPPEKRVSNFAKNAEIVERLRELIGDIPEVKSLSIRAQKQSSRHNDDPEPINLAIRGKLTEQNKEILSKLKSLIKEEIPEAQLESIYDTQPSKRSQINISLNEEGHRLGLTETSLARQIRSVILGTEITRIPRKTGEIKVFLKLPDEIREDRYALKKLHITLPSGKAAPLSSVANLSLSYSPARIFRQDGATVTNVIASPKDKDYDLVKLATRISPMINEQVGEYPELNWAFDGYLADYKEIRKRFAIGIVVLLFTLFSLLALPFNSLVQPFYVMLAVPFGIIGAFLGHVIMDITPSYMSMFGVLALSGVVINDSLILVDKINSLRKVSIPLKEALLTAVTTRFRPILLTSLTTFAGLLPLMFADSMQAQFLVPMAVSLGFGILFATFVTLLLVPTILLISLDIRNIIKSRWAWFIAPF